MLRRNILAGLASSTWTTLVGFAVVPLYLKYMGIEAYGIVGFFVTTNTLLQVLDLGLSPTLNREVARLSAAGTPRAAAPLLHTLAVVFWATALLLGAVLWAAAPAIADGWLHSRQLPAGTVARAVALMGAVIACRWPTSLYVGALMGAERLVTASTLAMAATAVGSFGAVAVLAFVSPTVEAFFLWQAAAGLAHALAARAAAWRAVGRDAGVRFDPAELRRVWRFSAAMLGITVQAVVFTQLDKLLLSRLLPLDRFGHYMLATTVASGLYLLVTPLFNASYPRFSALAATGDTEQLASLFRHGTRALAAALFPLALLLVLGGGHLVRVWTGDATIAARVAPIVAILAAGSALHGVMYLPYALQLAHGLTRLPLQINTILMLVLAPLLVVLALELGAVGGALAWLVLHALYVALGTWLTSRRLPRLIGATWLSRDVGVPLALSLVVGAAGREVLRSVSWPPLAMLLGDVAVAAIASAAIVATFPDLRVAASAVLQHAVRASPRGPLP